MGEHKILGVGDLGFIDDVRWFFNEEFKERNIRLDEKTATDITSAIGLMDGEKYSGIILSTLAIQTGEAADKYNLLAKSFEKFDIPGCLFYSGGTYLALEAKERGLVTAVYQNSREEDEAMNFLRQNGVGVINERDDILNRIYGFFNSKLQ